MKRTTLMLTVALSAFAGCSADLENAEVRQVAGQASALYLNCSSELEAFISNYQVAAGIATTMAYNNYDPSNAAAVKYFGTNHNSDVVQGMLKDTLGIAYSNEAIWSCDPAGAGDGTNCDNGDTVLYTKDNAQQTGDWTIHVCGDRILEREGHQDSSADASPTGALVHEISHLAGSWCDNSYGDGPVLQRAQDNNPFATSYAEAYRYYVMNWDQE